MANMTANLGEKLLNHIFNNTSWASPTTVYLALYTSACTDDDSGNEVTGSGYARQPISLKSITYAYGKVQGVNDGDIEFPVAGEDWGEVTHVAIWSDLSSVDLNYYLFWGQLTVPIDVKSGYILRLVDGEASVSMD
jgi:hypothetical protein